jgi:hypothetical protein
MHSASRSHIEHVKLFLKWNGPRFDALDEVHEAIPDPVGWRRGQGDKREFWIRPDVWRDIFDNEPDVAVDAARTLREIGLLRVQDTENCQAVVIVRKKSVRAYVVKAKILDWQPTEPYGIYGAARTVPKHTGAANAASTSSAIVSVQPD